MQLKRVTKAQLEESQAKPFIAKVDFGNVPDALKVVDHWILWRWEWKRVRKCWVKIPIATQTLPSGKNTYPNARSNDPATWGGYEDNALLCALAEESGNVGLGFVVSNTCNIVAIDLD